MKLEASYFWPDSVYRGSDVFRSCLKPLELTPCLLLTVFVVCSNLLFFLLTPKAFHVLHILHGGSFAVWWLLQNFLPTLFLDLLIQLCDGVAVHDQLIDRLDVWLPDSSSFPKVTLLSSS